MTVFIPSALYSYTGGKPEVDAQGETVEAILQDLDRRYPGLRFRIVDEQDRVRRHMKIFVNLDQTRDLSRTVAPDDEVSIIMALSGGRG